MSRYLVPVRLLLVAVLILGLMMLSPADAVKGAYPGSNGKIAFTANDPTYGGQEVFMMNPDGTGIKNLSNNHDGADYSPVWSPDGTKIAFTRHIHCEQQECRRIFVMNADGTGQRQLTAESPEDGLIFHYRPAWSPDGTKIAYTRLVSPSTIFVIGADEAGLGSPLIPNGDYASWSPDGMKMLFASDGIKVADANTGAVIATLITGSSPGMSPDGSMIVFEGNNLAIWMAKADGSEQRQLTAPTGILQDRLPNWSPDGTKIVFERIPFVPLPPSSPPGIYVVNADGSGEPTNLTPELSGARSPDWQRLASAATSSAAPVGGEVASVNTFAVIAPWLAVIGAIAVVVVGYLGAGTRI